MLAHAEIDNLKFLCIFYDTDCTKFLPGTGKLKINRLDNGWEAIFFEKNNDL